MARKDAARTQHAPGVAPAEEREERTGHAVRSALRTKAGTNHTDAPGPIPRSDDPARPKGIPPEPDPGADAQISAARAAWLETIRALARAAAQQDHDTALRRVQGEGDGTKGELE
jgi:hypothetical protein